MEVSLKQQGYLVNLYTSIGIQASNDLQATHAANVSTVWLEMKKEKDQENNNNSRASSGFRSR
jgi:hypothetical protein